MEEREEFLTARQLADVLQVSESTVRRLARKRRIPSVRLTPRIIRFHLDAVREALEVPRSRIRHGEYSERVDSSQLSFDDLTMLT
jgi:excisionase family DNA binding protein